LPTDELVPLAEKLLEVPVELVRIALDLERTEGTVIADSVTESSFYGIGSRAKDDIP
jgi:exodeoxyribonuclease V alpha subunit